LGETAPLLLIGMVAFVQNFPAAPPEGFFDPASALPVQVYNWTQRADPAFIERASGAIIVLLVFLLHEPGRHLPAPQVRAPLVIGRKEKI
jgi:phosphate transport system permease protein